LYFKLEYLAVYGRASVGDYTMDVRSAYWQFSISSQHMVKSFTLNPYSLWAYLIWNFAPIFGQQISILDSLALDFLVRLGLNFHPMGEFGGRGSIGPQTFFVTDRNVTT